MKRSSIIPITRATRSQPQRVSDGQIDYRAIGDACARMGNRIRGVPKKVRNVFYGLTRHEPRTKKGHLLGQWPDVAHAFAAAGSPLIDVMAPAYEVERQLRREVYRPQLPTLIEAETREAECQLRLHTAEIKRDPMGLRDAAIGEREAAQTLLEVLETQDGEPLYV